MLIEVPSSALKEAKTQGENLASFIPLEEAIFRNYVNSKLQERVSQFYNENHRWQTFDFVMEKKRFFSSNLGKLKMSLWDAVQYLNEVVDYSDPDTELPQIVHLAQTGEAIRKYWPGEEYDWFHLTGFIHDLGKILAHPKLFDQPQWGVVGDTFPVGCAYSDGNVFKEYFAMNPDSSNPNYNTKFGIYHEGIGLDNVHLSWGHDEYLYQVCVQNGCTLPPQALAVIRYHSFYPWHQKGDYDYLTNEKDRENLKWVKEFQKYDLYSKLPEKPDLEKVLPYYKGLITKYFPAILNW